MKQKFSFLLLFMLLFCTVGWAQQERKITGTVTADGAPLSFASVMVKGTSHGTQTDENGNYTINVKEGDVLEFSFMGFSTVTRKVSGTRPINVTLTEEANQLDEVVVMAYGTTQKKAKVTNSVATVKAEALSTGSFANPAQALSGAVAGLRVAQTSGSPGAAPSLVLRGGTNLDGSGSPLIIIDGQIRGGLNDINPDDIESMDILKDAGATAIYGARASNGVVLVTTKKGKSGASSLSVKLKNSFSYMNNQVEFLNARDYLYWQRTAIRNAARVWQNSSGDWKGFTSEGSLSGVQPYGTANKHFASMTDDTVLNANENGNAYWSTMFSESLSASQKQRLLSEGWQTMTDPITGKELIFYDFSFKKAAFRPFAY